MGLFGLRVAHFLGDSDEEGAPVAIEGVHHHYGDEHHRQLQEIAVLVGTKFLADQLSEQNEDEEQGAHHDVDDRVDQIRNAEADHHASAERGPGPLEEKHNSEEADHESLVYEGE